MFITATYSRFLFVLALVLVAVQCIQGSRVLWQPEQVPWSVDPSTPFDNSLANKLEYRICDEEKNTLTVHSVSIDPNPPQKGQKLTVTLVVSLSSPVDRGAQLWILVKYMRIKLLERTFDMCQELDNAGDKVPLKCPVLEQSETKWTYSVDLPAEILNGVYSIDLKIRDHTGAQVICANAVMTFSP